MDPAELYTSRGSRTQSPIHVVAALWTVSHLDHHRHGASAPSAQGRNSLFHVRAALRSCSQFYGRSAGTGKGTAENGVLRGKEVTLWADT